MSSPSESWSGRLGFVLANIGSAVGLGSIWKFPYEVGDNGGSSFLLFYVVGLLLIVLPLLFAELIIGRRGRTDALRAIVVTAGQAGASRLWSAFVVVGIATGFLILSFYSVIGGWAIAFFLETGMDALAGGRAERDPAQFDRLLASPTRLLIFHALFMAATALIVARGIAGGIERAAKVLMPVLIALLAAIAVYCAVVGDLAAAARFLFAFDPATLEPGVALEALGLGFFSIGVGLSAFITYAAYAGPQINLSQVAWITVAGDTFVSFLAGLAVFPIVFAEGLDPSSGPGLVFMVLPAAFAAMPFGWLVAPAFFLLLLIAALGSAISLLELVVAPARRLLGASRARASILCAAACWVAGVATVLSFNLWSRWFPLRRIEGLETATVFDLLDHATSNLLLPIAGLGIALFAGWVLPRRLVGEELLVAGWRLTLLRVQLRYVVPGLIVLVALTPMFLRR